MADSLPLQPQRPDSPPVDSEHSLGSAPTVAGSAPGAAAASTVSEPASGTGGDSIRGMRQALQKKKEALVARKRELDATAPVRVSYSDEASDDPAQLQRRLSEVRGRLEVLNPIIAQLDADYMATAERLSDGKTTASETNMKLLAEIATLRSTIERQEAEKRALEHQLDQLDARCAGLLRDGSETSRSEADALSEQRRTLEGRLVKMLADLEVNKLDACAMMHEAVAVVGHAQRHGMPLVDVASGYGSDQGTSSGYASEVPGRTPFACDSHEPMAPWSDLAGVLPPVHGVGAGPRAEGSGAGRDAYAPLASAAPAPTDRDDILPWNMRPAENYYFLPPGGTGAATLPPPGPDGVLGSLEGGRAGSGSAQLFTDAKGCEGKEPFADAPHDGPSPDTAASLKRIFEAGTPHPSSGYESYETTTDDPTSSDHGTEVGAPSSTTSEPSSETAMMGAEDLRSIPVFQRYDQERDAAMLGAEDLRSSSTFGRGFGRPESLAPGAGSVQPGASDGATQMTYATNLGWKAISPENWNTGQQTPPTPVSENVQRVSPSSRPKNALRAAPTAAEAGAWPVERTPSGGSEVGAPIGSLYMRGLSYPADAPSQWPGSQATPASVGGETPRASPADEYGSTPPKRSRPDSYYTEGLRWDALSDWPASRATPNRSQEQVDPYGPAAEEQIRGVAQQMMARVPQSRPTSSNQQAVTGYFRGPRHWPPSPPTPLSSDKVTVDPERRTVVVRHGPPPPGYTSGLAWTGPTDWPGSSCATPAQASREALVHARPRPGSSVSAPAAEHSSSETLVQTQEDGSPRQDVNLPWNVRPAVNYTAPTGDSTATPLYEPPSGAAAYDGPAPYTAASLQRIFDEGFVHEAPSLYYTPPQECSSMEDYYTPFQSANEMFGDSSASEQEPEPEQEQTMLVLEPGFSPEADEPYSKTPSGHSLIGDSRPGSHQEREQFRTRSARLMSRYEGVQPCLPREALQRAADVCSEPFSSPRDGEPDREADPEYEPAQGEYGYQRYPQGYEPAQLWYGHDRASLPSDAGSEGVAGTYTTSDYAQSQAESEYPTSTSETSEMASLLTAQDGDEPGYDGPSPDTTRTLASIFEAGTGRMGSDRGGRGVQGGSPPESYEPAQGEYGYQRYPQGFEPAQMWYGHDRASLPGQATDRTPASGEGVPASTDQPTLGETEDYESVSPDTKKTLAKIFQDGTPYSVQDEGTGPSTGNELTGVGRDGDKSYEPAQGEYGYQRYPQGYEPPQMWYGHDRASLPSHRGPSQTPSDQTTPISQDSADYDYLSPDTTRTLASILEKGTPYPVEAADTSSVSRPHPDSEQYEPAQGEYGYQRFPQGYEPAQMWYGHDRASLPRQAAAGTPAASETAPTGQPASGELEDYESVSPDTKKTLAKIIREGTPYSVQEEGSGSGSEGGDDGGPSRAGRDGDEPYEPAQGEYGYQRYPQGYEPAQMWYGHDRASLPGQTTGVPASVSHPPSMVGAAGEENYDVIQPDTTVTLAKIFKDGTPQVGGVAAVSDDRSTGPAAALSEGPGLQDEEPVATCQDDLSRWSDTSVRSAETPPASRSLEYVPASGMYGFQPLLGPPSRGSLEHLRASDGTYTQGLCVWQCPDAWPPTPSTPRSSEDVSGTSSQPATEVMAEYTEGLRWDSPGKDWPQTPDTPGSKEDLPAVQYTQGLRWDHLKDVAVPTPPTPGSQQQLQKTAERPTSDENFDFVSPDTTRTMAALFEEGIPYMAHRKPAPDAEGEGYEPAQGEYGYQRYPQGYEPAQMWYGHDRASVPSPRSSQDLGSQAVSSTDPSPAITPRPVGGYEPAQGIYGFQRVFVDAASRVSARAAAADSTENLDGPCPDTSRSLERIFAAGTAALGEQRPLTPSPNLPAFLEKLTSSSESEDSASRRRGRPSDSVPAVRVPRNRFYSMEEMCTTASSQPNLAISSASAQGRVTPRPGDQQCYLPWTHQASVPYRESQGAQFVEDYQEPPLIEMDDQISIPTPTSSQSRRSDSEKANSEKVPPSEPRVDYFTPKDTKASKEPLSTDYKPPECSLASESKSVESAHNDIEDLLQRLRSLESRLHLVEDESQSKDRQIQELLSRLEALVSSTGSDAQDDLAQRLQTASETVSKLEQTESRLGKELESAKKEVDSYIVQLESFQSRSAEMERRLAESQRMQAAGDQQLQQLAQQCGQLTAERDQLTRQLEESRAGVAEKEARVERLLRQLQEYSERVEQLEKEMSRDEPPADKSDVVAENAYLKGRVAELELIQNNEEHWKEQAHEAGERARAMEKALDRLSSEKRTEEERRREVEAQLVQMVRRTSVSRPADQPPSSSTAEESSADELLDPQLCRRLQQLLDKLHNEGLKALSLVELRFVKAYASPSQLTPRSKAADSLVDVADMETSTLRRAVTRLVKELQHKQGDINTKVSKLARGLQEELVQVQQLQTALDAEHRSKLALTGRLGEQRGALGAMETDLVHALSELRGGEERLDQTRSSLDSRLHEFAAAKTATQQLVDREEKIVQELIRTTESGCEDLQRVQACLRKLDDAGERVRRLCSQPGGRGAVHRLAEQLTADQQRCRDMLACVECEHGRAVQLVQELGHSQTQTDELSAEQLEQRVIEQEQRSEKLEQQIDAACAEVRRTGADGNKALELKLRRLQQELRQVQAAHRAAAEDMQRPAADRRQDADNLGCSSAEMLIAVTTIVDTNVEAERVRTRLLQLAAELAGRDDSEPAPAPAPIEAVAATEPTAESEAAAESESAVRSQPTAEFKPAAEPEPAAKSGPSVKLQPAAESEPAAKSEPAVKFAPAVDEAILTRYKEQLESERAQWGQERRTLQSHIDQLDAELERLRVAAQPAPVVPQGEGDDGRVQEAHSRYMRAESYRRALCWQKRYLMILLGGYQETETMTLEKMVQLTGGGFLPDYRRLLKPVRKFRAVAWAVIAMLRMQYLVHRWTAGRRVAGPRRPGRRQQGRRSYIRRAPGGGSKSRSTSRDQSRPVPQPKPAAAPKLKTRVVTRPRPLARSLSSKPATPQPTLKPAAPTAPTKRLSRSRSPKPVVRTTPPKRVSHSPAPKKKTDSGPGKGTTKKSESPVREGEETRKDHPAVEFDVDVEQEEELTPRPDDTAGSSLGELLDRLDEDIDEALEIGEEETPRSFSRGSTVVLDEGLCDEVSLPLSITSLISSEESEITKFYTDYGSQPLPDMEMECGTTGSMPNLAALDVRSVTTASDIESDELELYLAQFDSLLLTRHGCSSPRLSASSTSQASRLCQ